MCALEHTLDPQYRFENTVTVSPFSADSFSAALGGQACGTDVIRQVAYLTRYCASLDAKTFVVESHYVDRHFVDEHALYYSRLFAPPGNAVRRVHVFSRDFSAEAFRTLLDQSLASEDARAKTQEVLQSNYIGFISVRPVPPVPIGRTVLQPLRKDTVWGDAPSHRVHLANLELRIHGIPFQQQDIAVGACATASLWSALSRVARLDGKRSPTPAEITEAAARHLLPNGRSLPAHRGLTVHQLSDAIRANGFAPETVCAVGTPEVFAFALHTYLRSGLPALLELEKEDGGHAVTAVGFRLSNQPDPLLASTVVPCRSSRLSRVFVHDDRLGPYARADIRPFPATEDMHSGVLLEIKDDSPGSAKEQWVLSSALVPVYPKLRLPAESLLELSLKHAFIIDNVVGSERAFGLEIECRYEQAGAYLASLSGRVPRPNVDFLQRVALSRWCAVVQWLEAERPVAEFVYDTTDILRPASGGLEFLRAIVGLDDSTKDALSEQARALSVPFT